MSRQQRTDSTLIFSIINSEIGFVTDKQNSYGFQNRVWQNWITLSTPMQFSARASKIPMDPFWSEGRHLFYAKSIQKGHMIWELRNSTAFWCFLPASKVEKLPSPESLSYHAVIAASRGQETWHIPLLAHLYRRGLVMFHTVYNRQHR